MKDIELAKELLLKEDYALVVAKDGEIIFKSREKGIKPMYILSTEIKDEAYGASIADRVIGKGAALLCGYLDIKRVHGNLVSKAGLKTLDENDIKCTYDEFCEYIKNRDKTDYCPIEKLSMDTDDPKVFLEKVKVFLSNK